MKWFHKKTSRAGYSFASRAEGELFDYLKLLEAAGELRDIQPQDNVHLTEARILYIADFKAFDVKQNRDVWYEFKGFETDVWRIKRRLWKHYGPGPLRVFMKNSVIYLKEEIIPK